MSTWKMPPTGCVLDVISHGSSTAINRYHHKIPAKTNVWVGRERRNEAQHDVWIPADIYGLVLACVALIFVSDKNVTQVPEWHYYNNIICCCCQWRPEAIHAMFHWTIWYVAAWTSWAPVILRTCHPAATWPVTEGSYHGFMCHLNILNVKLVPLAPVGWKPLSPHNSSSSVIRRYHLSVVADLRCWVACRGVSCAM